MLAIKLILIGVFAALAACSSPVGRTPKDGQDTEQIQSDQKFADTEQKSKQTPISDPTTREAATALGRMLLAGGFSYNIYGPLGGVTGCVDGQDVTGRIVRTCNLCAVVLTASSRNLQIERSEFNILFRRAVSSQQPDIAPLDNGGVWVASTTGDRTNRIEVPRNQIFMSRELTNDDLGPLGLERQPGTVCFPPEPGLVVGMCRSFSSEQVLNVLAKEDAENKMRELVGSCT